MFIVFPHVVLLMKRWVVIILNHVWVVTVDMVD